MILKLSNNLFLFYFKIGNVRKLILFLVFLVYFVGDKVVVRCDMNVFDYLVCWKLFV